MSPPDPRPRPAHVLYRAARRRPSPPVGRGEDSLLRVSPTLTRLHKILAIKRMMLPKDQRKVMFILNSCKICIRNMRACYFLRKEEAVVILSVSQLPTHMEEGSLPPGIRDHVFYLEGDHMHSSIQKFLACSFQTESWLRIDFPEYCGELLICNENC
ncbi:uncharacterized protein LOC124704313 isoform X2 [Lolium rigidum]|uniref:uncharacterized protein LOC124704313 isoform X2 n=2 Tax=Lolium rigidum TaxID=89674 RepID=UPI001F5D4550|nr:uncharacterized protein LOC124704313 isoform X2 [Lolium rigidum]